MRLKLKGSLFTRVTACQCCNWTAWCIIRSNCNGISLRVKDTVLDNSSGQPGEVRLEPTFDEFVW